MQDNVIGKESSVLIRKHGAKYRDPGLVDLAFDKGTNIRSSSIVDFFTDDVLEDRKGAIKSLLLHSVDVVMAVLERQEAIDLNDSPFLIGMIMRYMHYTSSRGVKHLTRIHKTRLRKALLKNVFGSTAAIKLRNNEIKHRALEQICSDGERYRRASSSWDATSINQSEIGRLLSVQANQIRLAMTKRTIVQQFSNALPNALTDSIGCDKKLPESAEFLLVSMLLDVDIAAILLSSCDQANSSNLKDYLHQSFLAYFNKKQMRKGSVLRSIASLPVPVLKDVLFCIWQQHIKERATSSILASSQNANLNEQFRNMIKQFATSDPSIVDKHTQEYYFVTFKNLDATVPAVPTAPAA